MSAIILFAIRQATPQSVKMASPRYNSDSLFRPVDSRPVRSTKGMMSRLGSDVSIWISRSDAFGNMLFISPKIGDTASPGNDVTADTDQIAISVIRDIVPLPVLILIIAQFFCKSTQKECPNSFYENKAYAITAHALFFKVVGLNNDLYLMQYLS